MTSTALTINYVQQCHWCGHQWAVKKLHSKQRTPEKLCRRCSSRRVYWRKWLVERGLSPDNWLEVIRAKRALESHPQFLSHMCVACGREYKKSHSDQKYCSPACAHESYRVSLDVQKTRAKARKRVYRQLLVERGMTVNGTQRKQIHYKSALFRSPPTYIPCALCGIPQRPIGPRSKMPTCPGHEWVHLKHGWAGSMTRRMWNAKRNRRRYGTPVPQELEQVMAQPVHNSAVKLGALRNGQAIRVQVKRQQELA